MVLVITTLHGHVLGSYSLVSLFSLRGLKRQSRTMYTIL